MNVEQIKTKANELKALYDNYLRFKTQKFANVALETTGGETLYIAEGDELKVGTPCFKVNEAGEMTPCEDGVYMLTDGNSIEILDGLINEIAASEEEGTESPEETAAPEAETMAEPSNVSDMEDATSGVEERISALESALEKITEMLQGLMAKQEADMSKMSARMSKMFSVTNEEFNRESGKSESVSKGEKPSGKVFDEIKEYWTFKNYSPQKMEAVEKTNFNYDVNEINEFMSKARTGNGGFNSPFSITN